MVPSYARWRKCSPEAQSQPHTSFSPPQERQFKCIQAQEQRRMANGAPTAAFNVNDLHVPLFGLELKGGTPLPLSFNLAHHSDCSRGHSRIKGYTNKTAVRMDSRWLYKSTST